MCWSQVCTLGWHAIAAGAKGVADLALKPTLTRQANVLQSSIIRGNGIPINYII